MNLLKKIAFSTRLKSFQTKNEAVLDCLTGYGFSMAEVRKAMMTLNNIKLADLVNGTTSVVTASNTIAGRRRHDGVMRALADRLDVKMEHLFPEEGQ